MLWIQEKFRKHELQESVSLTEKAKNRYMTIWLYNILSNLVHVQELKYTVHCLNESFVFW